MKKAPAQSRGEKRGIHMDDFLMKPKVDFAFKEIMMDEKARVGFLSAVLKLDPADIKETRILNTDLRKVHADDKLGILDVRILMNNDTEIDTEIQLSELKVWADRSLFYLSKMFTDQLKEGESYTKLKKCVSISILNFNLFPAEREYYSCFHIWEDMRHILYTDKMEFHVIELPKLPPECRGEENGILLWAKFINAERKEEFDMLAGRDPYIDSAYEHLRVISQDEHKRQEYEARQKAFRDYNAGMEEAEQRGERRGKDEKALEIARKMVTQGYDIEGIASLTGLTAEQVENLR